MNFTRLQISIILAFTAAVWFGILCLFDVEVTTKHLMPFSSVVGLLVVFALLVEHVFWKFGWLQKWFVARPNLNGTWEVEIVSSWVNPDTGEEVPPIKCYMGVSQSLSTLQMHLMTEESESWCIAQSIQLAQSGKGYQISAVYTNKPRVTLRESRSSMHLGAFVMETHGNKECFPEHIGGEYWTDRKTTGTISMSNRSPTLHTRFEDARTHFEAKAC